ncbi:hypothetical protein, partial [Xanthomonas perforans]|uniref:hypothetical protein n=1 Tax=Xanthomonas perforans TaxID=442694 RepID=UPI0019CF620F
MRVRSDPCSPEIPALIDSAAWCLGNIASAHQVGAGGMQAAIASVRGMWCRRQACPLRRLRRRAVGCSQSQALAGATNAAKVSPRAAQA